ncbi:MAG: acyltransferase family protein [Acetobacteraceae bacterium]
MMTMERESRLNALTGLRGIAAYSVLLAHGIDTSFIYGAVAAFHPAAARLAYFGMSLFFVLSGFVIHYNYGESFSRDRLIPATYKFFVARFARLYPLYALSILISLSYIPGPYFADDPTTAFSYLTLTQS